MDENYFRPDPEQLKRITPKIHLTFTEIFRLFLKKLFRRGF